MTTAHVAAVLVLNNPYLQESFSRWTRQFNNALALASELYEDGRAGRVAWAPSRSSSLASCTGTCNGTSGDYSSVCM